MAKSNFIQDFKAFAMKGNVIDMAVGVIIGGAFGKIVTSLVNNVLMPPIGWIIGGVNFKDLAYTLPANPMAPEGTEPATIAYGEFIQNTIDFLIIAFCAMRCCILVSGCVPSVCAKHLISCRPSVNGAVEVKMTALAASGAVILSDASALFIIKGWHRRVFIHSKAPDIG
jgi:large conductance mechanosensitive channel